MTTTENSKMAACSSGTRGLKHSKSTGDLTENTEQDLQNIFKKLRVDIEPKKPVSRRGKLRALINRKDRHEKSKNSRGLIREAKFVYRGLSQRKKDLNNHPHTDADIDTIRNLQDDEGVKCETKVVEKRRKSTTDIKGYELPKGCGQEFRNIATYSASSLCSASARFDDITPDELAAYFEELLNIPKRMSSMAEMMYT